MWKAGMNKLAAFILVSCLAVAFGCLFGPDADQPKPVGKTFKPLTDKENVIYNLMLSYEQADITHYEELLHPNYVWYNQKIQTIPPLPEFTTRQQDLKQTTNMFLAKKGQCPDPNKNLSVLTLEISSGTWTRTDTGSVCTDCWSTTRSYTLTARLPKLDITHVADDLVQIIVVPVDAGGQTFYKIWRMTDLPK